MELHPLGSHLPPPAAPLKLSVIVPAKNEEYTIYATLEALYHQVDQHNQPLNKAKYEVIVLANNCTDATASVAQAFAEAHPDFQLFVVALSISPPYAHIGYVRRLLMDEAHRRFTLLNRPRGVIASTDSDTVVSPNWIATTLHAVAQAADAVGGRILAPPRCLGRRYYLQDVAYRFLQTQLESIIDPDLADPWPRHFQNFGPSLAVTSEMYERAGRMPVVPSLEDVRFYEALQRCDARIRHSPRVRVLTSARPRGRVAFGFSGQLQKWEQMEQQKIPFMVPGADYWRFRFILQRQVRYAWQTKSFTLWQFVARSLLLSPYELYDRMSRTDYFGEFWQWLMALPEVENQLTQRFAPVDITTATADLRRYVRETKPFVPIDRAGSGPYAGVSGVVPPRSMLRPETPRGLRRPSMGS